MKTYYLISLLLVVAALFPSPLHLSAEPDLPAMRFDHAFDLGSPGSQAFIQDDDGFLWMGTEDNGMFRYDGYELKHYGVGPGLLPNGHVYKMIIDRENPDIFWLATGGGMQRFNKTTETFTYYQHDPEDPGSLGHNTVNDVFQDSTNPDVLWLGTENGLNRFDKAAETFVRYEPDPDDPNSINHPGAWRIIEDGADPNIIWIGTFGGGLDRFDKTTETFTHHVHDPEDPSSFGNEDDVIGAVIQDKDDSNILWIGALASGMDKFDKRTGTFTHYIHDLDDPGSIRAGVVASIHDDGYGRLWLGGWVDNNGLAIFDKATETFTHYKHDPADPYSLSSDFIVNVYEDRSGIFWITTFSGEVDKFDRYTQNFTLYQSSPYNGGLSDDVVTAMLEDRSGDIWFGSRAGLNRLDRETGAFTHYLYDPDDPDSLDNDNVACLYEDSSGAFWVCVWPGPLMRLDRDTGKVLNRYSPGTESFTDIVEDPDDPGVLWLGTRLKGLARFDRRTETFTFYPTDRHFPERGPLSNFIYIVEHDREEAALWIGGWESGGLSRFDIATETFTHYKHQPNDPTSLAADAIATIYHDTSGVLWIGTQGGGLDRFDEETGQFTHYAQDVGIPSDVNAILEDDGGHLWLSTNEGILHFDPQTVQVEMHYTQSDGLQGEVFFRASSLKARDGTFWFGGTNGANSFRPDTLVTNPHEPPVVLTSLTQGGEPIDGGDGKVPNEVGAITLDWQQNFFEFEFAALNYTMPTSNHYRYILEGLDKDWYDAGTRRFGRYAGLPPGSYTLRIIGANNDGVWNETGTSLKVTVTAPFWQTWWFYALGAAAIVGVFLLAYRQKNRQLRNERAVAAERARLMRQIQKHADQVHQIINAIPEGVFLLDPDHVIVLANPTADKHLKILANASVGDRLERLGNRALTDLLTSPPRGLWHEIEADGDRLKSFEVITHSTETGSGIDGWVVVVRDVTREREIQLHAQQQNRLAAVGQLAAGIAHDFNNIMTVIILYVQILEKTADLPDRVRERLNTITSQARRATALIDQILDFSRRSVMEATPLNLEPFIKEQVKLLQRVVPENILIHTASNAGEVIVNADPTRIQQVIMNLVLNARDAMPNGGEVHIVLKRIRVREQDAPLPGMKGGEWAQIAVADTGTGIAPEILPNIFEPFFTTKAPGEGTGLGLAQVYGIVKQHEGYIDVDTKSGRGTTFTLYFPLLLAKPVEAQAPAIKGAARGNGETILVVEDNPAARKALVESLELLNYHALQTANGKEALATWTQHRDEIALVLSDAVMPEMGGIALFHALKQETSAVKVVLLTGHLLDTRPENQFEALMRQGLTGWLRKPIDLEALAAMLAESFSK